MPRIDRAELNKGLRLLGVDLQPIVQAASVTEAGDKLIRTREQARKALKQLAKTHHPDVTGGDEDKAAEFVAANNANDWLQTAQVRPRPMPQPPSFRYYPFRSGTGTATTTTTVTGFGGWTRVTFS